MKVDLTGILDAALVERATRFFTGELGWTREDVPEVASSITAKGYAILGGDIWIKRDDGLWLPLGAGGTWDTKPEASDSYSDYASRCLRETLAYVASQPTAGDDLRRYVLTCESLDFITCIAGQAARKGR